MSFPTRSRVAILPVAEGAGTAGQATAEAVRAALARAASAALVGGTAVSIVDEVHSFYVDFPDRAVELVDAGLGGEDPPDPALASAPRDARRGA